VRFVLSRVIAEKSRPFVIMAAGTARLWCSDPIPLVGMVKGSDRLSCEAPGLATSAQEIIIIVNHVYPCSIIPIQPASTWPSSSVNYGMLRRKLPIYKDSAYRLNCWLPSVRPAVQGISCRVVG
jgi:hypothetical protein